MHLYLTCTSRNIHSVITHILLAIMYPLWYVIESFIMIFQSSSVSIHDFPNFRKWVVRVQTRSWIFKSILSWKSSYCHCCLRPQDVRCWDNTFPSNCHVHLFNNKLVYLIPHDFTVSSLLGFFLWSLSTCSSPFHQYSFVYLLSVIWVKQHHPSQPLQFHAPCYIHQLYFNQYLFSLSLLYILIMPSIVSLILCFVCSLHIILVINICVSDPYTIIGRMHLLKCFYIGNFLMLYVLVFRCSPS